MGTRPGWIVVGSVATDVAFVDVAMAVISKRNRPLVDRGAGRKRRKPGQRYPWSTLRPDGCSCHNEPGIALETATSRAWRGEPACARLSLRFVRGMVTVELLGLILVTLKASPGQAG